MIAALLVAVAAWVAVSAPVALLLCAVIRAADRRDGAHGMAELPERAERAA